MTQDLFPVYCRQCRKAIDSSARTCPHCGTSQGLAGTQPDSVSQTSTTQQPATQAGVPNNPNPQQQGYAICGICNTQVTPGDHYCRACGEPLIPVHGSRRNQGGSDGTAYGLSALVSIFCPCGLAGVILGLAAIFKGARGLGCLAVFVSLVLMVVVLMGSFGYLSYLQNLLPGEPGGIRIPYEDLIPD